MIEQADLRLGQRESWGGIRARTVEHRHPEDAPAQDAVDRDQIGQALSGPELRLLGSTARFEDLVEHLDLPSQGIPVEFFNGFVARLNRQIGDQLPVDLLSVLRCPAFLSMDHGQRQCRISLLFSDWRQDAYLAVPDLENGLVWITVAVPDLDAMQPFDRNLVHFIGDRVIAVSGQAVDTGPHQEMRSDLLCRAEEFVDITLAITDMDASTWITQQFHGLLQIVQPPDALLFVDWHARRIDLLFERSGPLELLPGPEFDRRQSERHPLGRYRQARMHQDAANRVRSQATRLVATAVDGLGDADRLDRKSTRL